MLGKLFGKLFKKKDEELFYDTLDDMKSLKIKESVEENYAFFKKMFTNCSDVVIKEIKIHDEKNSKALLIYTSGLIDKQLFDSGVLKTLLLDKKIEPKENQDSINLLKEQFLCSGTVEIIETVNAVVKESLIGKVVLIIDNHTKALTIEIPKWEMRTVEEPPTEPVMKGARDGFTETLKVNIAIYIYSL